MPGAFPCPISLIMPRSYFKRLVQNGIGSIELNIGKTTVAAISMKAGLKIAKAKYLQFPLLESLRTGQPVMAAPSNLYTNATTFYTQGKMVTSGGNVVFDAPVS
ncbi:hypothetical protein BGX30_008443 [Mortierella sp. GBA39]|nr:hypothetical protein BGX30_008443 [Mortierella sp. GBA39]